MANEPRLLPSSICLVAVLCMYEWLVCSSKDMDTTALAICPGHAILLLVDMYEYYVMMLIPQRSSSTDKRN